MTDKLEQLTRIFTEAEQRGDIAHGVAETLLERVLEVEIDMMLDLAAAQHEVQRLQEQRDATRIYLGVALSDTEDENGDDFQSPADALREEVRRILIDVGIHKKIVCIKELRCSEKATRAWADLGNNPSPPSGGPRPPGWMPSTLGLKESKDIIDAAQTGRLWLGVKGYVEL